jgi:hypothetical protein
MRETEDQLVDLAGNAMSTTVVTPSEKLLWGFLINPDADVCWNVLKLAETFCSAHTLTHMLVGSEFSVATTTATCLRCCVLASPPPLSFPVFRSTLYPMPVSEGSRLSWKPCVTYPFPLSLFSSLCTPQHSFFLHPKGLFFAIQFAQMALVVTSCAAFEDMRSKVLPKSSLVDHSVLSWSDHSARRRA